MTVEKEKLESLQEKLEEIIMLLKEMADDLRTVSASLKSMAVSQITHPTLTSPAPLAQGMYEGQRSVETVRTSFPPELENLISVEERNDCIIIKPKQFLGSENFAKIASAVRGMGGEYISAGKDSHFRVSKRKS